MQLIANSVVARAHHGSLVPKSVALKLIQTYRIEDGWAPYKTRAAWFSIRDLYDILSLVDSKKGDGVRIYLGKYPSNIDLPGTPDVKYKNQSRTTMVFVPTIGSQDGTHQNIFPIESLTSADKEIIITDDPLDTFNHGELEP
jgi:hypothetical protein